jgi:Sulfotransferase domain
MNIEQMANVTTGSNYAKDWSVAPLVDSNSTQGPFLHKPELSVPRNVLTKTHCYGYCDDCPPRVYVASTERKFEDGCLRSELPNHGGDGMYKASIPQKAVHLFRNPFDNIVARMHLAVKKREKMGWSPEQLASFGNSKEGLDAWCEYLDDKYAHAEADYFPLSLRKQYLDSLPCHADWYRYVMWHNHAFALSKKLKIPVHTLYYEDYTLRFDETVADLLHFLELSPRQPPVEFYVGKSYEHFFEASHARKAAALVQGLGSKETWEHTRHYFEPYLTSTP